MDASQLLTDPAYGIDLILSALVQGIALGAVLLALTLAYRTNR